MARPPKTPPAFVNWRGEALDLRDLIPGRQPSAAKPKAPITRAAAPAAADLDSVHGALCLAGCARHKTWLLQFMRLLACQRSDGGAFDASAVGQALDALVASRRVALDVGGAYDLSDADRAAHLPRVLALPWAADAWQAWARAGSPYPLAGSEVPHPSFRQREEVVGLARLVIYGGMQLAAFEQARRRVLGANCPPELLAEALTKPFMPARWEAADPAMRDALLSLLQSHLNLDQPLFASVMDWLDQRLADAGLTLQPTLRFALAHRRLQRGDGSAALEAALPLIGSSVSLLRAVVPVLQGQWAAVAQAVPPLLKEAAKSAGMKRGFAPRRLLEWHLLSLLASSEPAQWTQAQRLAVQESGSRNPAPDGGWGLWAHAIAARLGDASLQPGVLDAHPAEWDPRGDEDNAHRLILAAWLDAAPKGFSPAVLKHTLAGLRDNDLLAKAQLVQLCIQRLGLAQTSDKFDAPDWARSFFGAPREAWRDALAAIEALGTPAAASGAKAEALPLQWRLRLDAWGRVASLLPFERPAGVRGRGKAKPVPLSRLKKAERLSPLDAAVARCITAPRWAPHRLRLDTVAATLALVGHPDVVFEDAPEQPVDLREGLPLLEVRRQRSAQDTAGSESFVFHLADTLTAPPMDLDEADFDSELEDPLAEADRRNGLRVVRDAPDRGRLLRLNAAQRRVAELVAKRWAVPVAAKSELDAALRVLAGHFQLHSDATAGQEVPSESRLRALLSPQGEGLQLRLVVQPFGNFGPAVQPGHGRERLLALHEGLHLATQRDLDAEAAHLDSVLQALPALAGAEAGDNTWLLSEPEQALAVLEQLPSLPAVSSVDWPRGKPVRVQSVATQALQIKVKSGVDWLGLQGELQLEEGQVLGLQRLLQMAHDSRRGRFIALGDGHYLALTEQLRRQLADLNALAQSDGSGMKLPAAAAAWLAETLDAASLQGDPTWQQRLQRMDEAAALQPEPPAALQAQLRGYQAEGFAWMARLAHAGLGACLADDMGLGKTVQTLALLLHRAALGPALVLAPTSVCSNWVDEAARFAPGLRVLPYGELPGDSDRSALLQGLAPGDVVVASYALAQIDGEAFAVPRWSTLVLDEAQALKNAVTKRAKAVAALQADFRLALTGTPVENRLSDLWSIMNLLNPGLLGSSTRFGEKFAGPIERERDDAARLRLRRLVSPFLLRRTKAQVLTDLPPRTEIIHRVQPGAEERAFLEAARRAALARVAEAASAPTGQANFHVLAELTRLRRAACDPRLVAPELGLVGAKVHEFEQLAVELVAGRHKALVFSQFTDFLALLGERLQAAGLRYQYLDGSTPAAERGKRVAAFQRGEGDLFLISLKAGGFGLNLTAADYVIIVDPWWNPAAEDQALGRAHRIGQARPVTVYRLVTAGSVEERIVALHHDKRALADGILDNQDGSAPLAADDLRALLREGD
jgi:superfamily II DNA or RNA helicase